MLIGRDTTGSRSQGLSLFMMHAASRRLEMTCLSLNFLCTLTIQLMTVVRMVMEMMRPLGPLPFK